MLSCCTAFVLIHTAVQYLNHVTNKNINYIHNHNTNFVNFHYVCYDYIIYRMLARLLTRLPKTTTTTQQLRALSTINVLRNTAFTQYTTLYRGFSEMSSLGGSNADSASSNSGFGAGKREVGTVKWFDASKGFGFIVRESGEDIFVHFSGIRGTGYRTLEEGQRVEFVVATGHKGVVAQDVVLNTAQ